MSTICDVEEHDFVEVTLDQPIQIEDSIPMLEALQNEVLMRNMAGFVS